MQINVYVDEKDEIVAFSLAEDETTHHRVWFSPEDFNKEIKIRLSVFTHEDFDNKYEDLINMLLEGGAYTEVSPYMFHTMGFLNEIENS